MKALAFRDAHTADAKTYDDLKGAVETGFAFSYWCGSAECEAKIKEETKATMRCIPLDSRLAKASASIAASLRRKRGFSAAPTDAVSGEAPRKVIWKQHTVGCLHLADAATGAS